MLHKEDSDKLKEKFNVHPLIFQRSIEHSKSIGELFDILDFMPKEFPIIWDNKEHRWVVSDLLLTNKLENTLEQ
jgi:hypothetical protein